MPFCARRASKRVDICASRSLNNKNKLSLRTTTKTTTTTTLHGSTFWNEKDNNENQDDEPTQRKQAASGIDDRFIVLSTPALMTAMAFALYPDTSAAFHSFVDVASGHTWAAVDGGKYLNDLITPALNGPVASFISLLFGTLTSMTVSTLYQRQFNMYQATSDLLEDVRLVEIHFQYFPVQYREQALGLLRDYQSVLAIYFDEESDPSREQIVKSRETGRIVLEKLLMLLHSISTGDDISTSSEQMSERILGEAYDTINRMIRTRSRLISTDDSSFPIWHYGNLSVLAAAICIIFLVLTDRTALQFLGGFQLRMCWGMLIGTISMLAAVVYDLNTPLSGVFQITRSSNSVALRILPDDAKD